jgi:hypothetical protein
VLYTRIYYLSPFDPLLGFLTWYREKVVGLRSALNRTWFISVRSIADPGDGEPKSSLTLRTSKLLNMRHDMPKAIGCILILFPRTMRGWIARHPFFVHDVETLERRLGLHGGRVQVPDFLCKKCNGGIELDSGCFEIARKVQGL